MIKKQNATLVEITCDKCGSFLQDLDDNTTYPSMEVALETAQDCCWNMEDGKQICSICDEEDEEDL